MYAINRMLAAAGLALALVGSLPALAAPQLSDAPASCRQAPCRPQICTHATTCPSPKPPTD